MDEKQLKRLQAYSTIAASIAVPILIAFFGWMLQSQSASESVRKDYVQMAVNILSREVDDEDAELREWAAKLLEESSPVPFPRQLRSNLASGTVSIVSPVPDFLLDSELMQPPEQTLELANDGTLTVGDVFEICTRNKFIAQGNSFRLLYLQKILHTMVDVYGGDKHAAVLERMREENAIAICRVRGEVDIEACLARGESIADP